MQTMKKNHGHSVPPVPFAPKLVSPTVHMQMNPATSSSLAPIWHTPSSIGHQVGWIRIALWASCIGKGRFVNSFPLTRNGPFPKSQDLQKNDGESGTPTLSSLKNEGLKSEEGADTTCCRWAQYGTIVRCACLKTFPFSVSCIKNEPLQQQWAAKLYLLQSWENIEMPIHQLREAQGLHHQSSKARTQGSYIPVPISFRATYHTAASRRYVDLKTAPCIATVIDRLALDELSLLSDYQQNWSTICF